MGEVRRGIGWLQQLQSDDRLALLHCVSAYPTPAECATLEGIVAMRELFDVPVGYSDHTEEIATGANAVAHGAVILEKHLTYDCQACGPDHASSLEPNDFAEYVRLAKAETQDVGNMRKTLCIKEPLDIEYDVRNVARQSVVTTRDLEVGEIITREHVTIKRPGCGIEPWQLDVVVGSCATTVIERDSVIQPHQIGSLCSV